MQKSTRSASVKYHLKISILQHCLILSYHTQYNNNFNIFSGLIYDSIANF